VSHPSSSGGYKANISLLRHLASRGHSVRQLCYSYRGEAEAYVQATTKSSGRDIDLRKRLLHIRAANGAPGTDVKVEELVMEDGVQLVALEIETFDAAFGGKKNVYKEMARETADYIEVIEPSNFAIATSVYYKSGISNSHLNQTGKLSARLHDFVFFLQKEIKRFSPTHIICNDGLSMQATSPIEMPSLSVCRIDVIHTAEQLPFGPFAGGVPGHVSSPSEFDLLQQLDGIWSVSKAINQYALEYGRLQTSFFVHHPWTYLEEKTHKMPVHLHNWDKQFIGMVNPCAVKGAQIFIDLAKSCPQYAFLAYKSWGFDDKIDKQMKGLQNIT
jgi:hypothetical protein